MSALVEPFAETRAQASSDQPWYEWVRLVTLRKCLWLQSLWSQTNESSANPHQQVSIALQSTVDAAVAEATFLETDPEAVLLSASIRSVEDALREHSAWSRLLQLFQLDRHDQELLAVCIAAEQYPEIKRAYAYVLDQTTVADPSQWVASSLFGWGHTIRIDPSSPLFKWRIACPAVIGAHSWSKETPWSVEPSIIDFLQGRLLHDSVVADSVKLRPKEFAVVSPCLYTLIRDKAIEAIDLTQSGQYRRYEVEISGSVGAGRRTLCSQIACDLNLDLLEIDCDALLAHGADQKLKEEHVTRVARSAALFGVLPMWVCEKSDVSPYLRDLGGVHFVVTQESGPTTSYTEVVRNSYSLPYLTRSQRTVLWESLTDSPVPEPVREWALNPADIVYAAKVTATDPNRVVEACQDRARLDSSELFGQVPCPYVWDDLVLTPQLESHLKEFESQARMRGAVYEEWGYSKHCPLGTGISALFAGPSGTGKTMAAQVIAKSLDLQLCRLDFAGVLNKYVGETEKRIREVFERCQRTNALLFIDEADALCSTRIQNSDSHSHYINAQIDYLLLQMEQYDGVAILATNRKAELDSAFLRRLRFVVDFQLPQSAERLRLWQRALLEKSPSGEPLLGEIDWDHLANKLTLTGAEIKNCAISAAFLAHSEGCKVGMSHVIGAVKRELTKKGVVMRPGDTDF